MRQVEGQLPHNQEDEELPKDCLRLGDRRHVHVDSKIDRCADEGDQRPDDEDVGGDYLKRFPKS